MVMPPAGWPAFVSWPDARQLARAFGGAAVHGGLDQGEGRSLNGGGNPPRTLTSMLTGLYSSLIIAVSTI